MYGGGDERVRSEIRSSKTNKITNCTIPPGEKCLHDDATGFGRYLRLRIHILLNLPDDLLENPIDILIVSSGGFCESCLSPRGG